MGNDDVIIRSGHNMHMWACSLCFVFLLGDSGQGVDISIPFLQSELITDSCTLSSIRRDSILGDEGAK